MTSTHLEAEAREGVVELLVVGAGPAGLAAAWAGRERGLEPLIIEKSQRIGGAWARMDPNMRCLSPRSRDGMPDGALPAGEGARATAAEILEAITAFAERAAFDIRFGTEATALSPGRPLRLHAGEVVFDADRIVVATGEYGRPYRPELEGEFSGSICHSSELDPSLVASGASVVVVGAGNTGAELAVRLAEAGAQVTLCARSPIVRPSAEPTGVLAEVAWRLSGLPIARIPGRGGCTERTPVVDPHLYDAVAAGRISTRGPAVGLVQDGVRLEDGSVVPAERVVLATGFRRELRWLEEHVTLNARSVPRNDSGLSSDVPGLAFLGLPCMRTRRSGFLRGFVGDAHSVVRRLL